MVSTSPLRFPPGTGGRQRCLNLVAARTSPRPPSFYRWHLARAIMPAAAPVASVTDEDAHPK